jgi:hypothetical protein
MMDHVMSKSEGSQHLFMFSKFFWEEKLFCKEREDRNAFIGASVIFPYFPLRSMVWAMPSLALRTSFFQDPMIRAAPSLALRARYSKTLRR